MKKILIIIGVLAVIGVMITVNILRNSSSQNEGEASTSVSKGFSFGSPKAVDVTTAIVKKSSLSSSILITGTVEVVDKSAVSLSSAQKITTVFVKVGDVVEKGSALFAVDTAGITDELATLRINREIQELQLKKLQSAKTTSSMDQADISVELSKLNLTSAQVAYDNQLATVEKNKVLFEEGIISQSELEAVESQTEPLLQQIQIATLNLQRSENEKTQLQKSNADTSKTLAIDVQIQLKNLESLDMNIAKLEKELEQIQEATVSPISGTVTEVKVEDGQLAMSTSELIIIEDMDRLRVKAMIREYDISHLSVGQEVDVTGDAIDKSAIVKGKISFISPLAVETMVNGRQGTGIEIDIDILEGTNFLKPGYTADCEITTQKKDNVIIASFDQFREDKDNNTYVFVVKDGIVHEQKITLGITSDFDAEVVDGLSEGDEVVVNPSLVLKEGTLVNPTLMNTEEGK